MAQKPYNTAADPRDPRNLLVAMPGGIEAQEAQGQRELINSESLPTRVSDKDKWVALGVTFGEPFADDALFCPSTLPRGWSKQRTEHSMWSDIVDAHGNKRGAVFYKAAFYDRDAFMTSPERRYTAQRRYDKELPDTFIYEVRDAASDGEVLYTTRKAHDTPKPDPDDRAAVKAWWAQRDACEEAAILDARAWLVKTFPTYADPAAYWPE